MRLQIRRIVYEDIDPPASELLSIAGAARLLGVSNQKVGALIRQGALTELVDRDAEERGRRYGVRYLLRSEVEELKREQGQGAG